MVWQGKLGAPGQRYRREGPGGIGGDGFASGHVGGEKSAFGGRNDKDAGRGIVGLVEFGGIPGGLGRRMEKWVGGCGSRRRGGLRFGGECNKTGMYFTKKQIGGEAGGLDVGFGGQLFHALPGDGQRPGNDDQHGEAEEQLALGRQGDRDASFFGHGRILRDEARWPNYAL